MEDIFNATPLKKDLQTSEPKVDQAVAKLRILQQGKEVLEEESDQIKSVRDSLQIELQKLQTEAYQLERVHKDKEELCNKLQFQFDESEQDCVRQLKNSKQSEGLMEQYKCEIQEYKLKHRKQRLKFEQQLHLLIEQHKNLRSIFTPERLPDEIKTTESRKVQLESAEMKLAQLSQLDEELQDTRTQKQVGIGP
ncbi:synaptonemal complex central element protein 1 isoform X2 [Cynoglossus semilaevis]|uniref:synaptonemal complex central element protein 1 isoform X2 n=1 Tax=Cynoglossus semilaevis TaxID=244447 RepID=UPI0007DC895B|nr:synaptonemal complex central element protein 1 isoform X2 [Cynoglossus semilaevis]